MTTTPKTPDWVGILKSQLDELPFDQEGLLRAIELCDEALAEIEPVYRLLFEHGKGMQAITKGVPVVYDATQKLGKK